MTYVRFHDISPSKRSFNYRDREWLPGVSVWCADINSDGCYLLYHPEGSTSAMNSLITMMENHLRARCPIYEVTGTELDVRGTDGEVLLTDVKILDRLTVSKGAIRKSPRS